MMFSAGTFIIASSLLTKNLYSYLKQEAWIGVLLGFIISVPIIWIYQALAKRFPSKSLIEINEAVFGRLLGGMISVLYIFYFLSLAFLNARELGSFVTSIILPQTPMAITLILFIIVCAWAVRKGMKNLTRCGFLFAVISIAIILFNFLLLYNIIKPENFLPIFSMPLKNYMMSAHLVAALPFCEIIAFFMLFPYMQKPGEFGKALRGGLMIGTITLLIIVVRDIAVLGSYTLVSTMPSFSVLRLIDVAEILTRLEILYAVTLTALLFFKVSILYFAAVSGFSRLLKFDSYRFLIYIFGALIVVYSIGVFRASYENTLWVHRAAATYSTTFVFVLPAITLIVAIIRSRFKKKKENPS